MTSSPICVDANLVIRLVADPSDEFVCGSWERWYAENRCAPQLVPYGCLSRILMV